MSQLDSYPLAADWMGDQPYPGRSGRPLRHAVDGERREAGKLNCPQAPETTM